jgi:hypothetical protein
MAIGKSAIIFVAFLIFAVALISIFSVAQKDSTGANQTYYQDQVNNTAALTGNMTQKITTSGSGMILPLTLVVGVLFLYSALMIFGKKK